MKTKLIDQDGCKRVIEVEVSTGKVEDKFTEIYKEIGKVAEVQGFRRGNAPKDIIEKKYSARAAEEVLKELVSNSYDDAIEELKIIPVELPKISDVKLERGKPLTYKAEVDIRPAVKIKKYKGLKINKNKTKIGDTDVEKALDNLREIHAKFVSTDDRAVINDDYIICDLVCSSGGKQVFKKEGMWLSVNKEGALKELYNAIIGMKKDEEKEIPVKLPKDYPDKNLAEKDVVYKVKINHIKEKKLPSLDNEFAKDLGKSTVEELKDAVKKDLIKRSEIAINEDMRNQLVNTLVKNSSFDVPESMASNQLENLVNNAKERMISQGVKEKDIESNTTTIREKLKPQATNQIKVLFLLGEIAQLENIKVEPSEIDKAVEVMAVQFKKDKKKLLEEYEQKNLLQHVVAQIREEKTIEFLLKEAEIVEKK